MEPTQQEIDLATFRRTVFQGMALVSVVDLSASSKEHAQKIIHETVIKAGRMIGAADWIILLAIKNITECLSWI